MGVFFSKFERIFEISSGPIYSIKIFNLFINDSVIHDYLEINLFLKLYPQWLFATI